MKVAIDLTRCCGCELCPDVCPEVFEMGPDRKAHVKTEEVPEIAEMDCLEIAQSCPLSAIKIRDCSIFPETAAKTPT